MCSKETEAVVLRGLYGLSDIARREQLEPTEEEMEEEIQSAVNEDIEDSPTLRRFVSMEMMVRCCRR